MMSSLRLRAFASKTILFFILPSSFFIVFVACTPRLDQAAWVTRFNIDSPREVEEICREAKTAELDSLLVQVRGRGDAYYRSALAPRAESLAGQPPGFDPLAETLAACAPLPVHAWLNVYYLWGGEHPPAHPFHPAQRDSGWLLEDADGRSVADYSLLDRAQGWIEGTYADPASPAYRELFAGVAREVAARYPVAGIHLDFVRYPGAAYGHGPLGEEFAARWGIDPRWLPTGVDRGELAAWLAGELPAHERLLTTAALLWAETRAAQVTALVRGVRETLAAGGRPVALSAAVFPEAGAAYLDKGQDWRTWAAAGLVDALYPMAYFGGPERVHSHLREIRSVKADGVRLWAGLGAYIKEPEKIGQEAAEARRLAFDGICLFDLGTLREKHGGSRPYVKASAGRRPFSEPPVSSTLIAAAPEPFGAASGGETLKAIVAKALGGVLPPHPDLDRLLAARWLEFTAARPLFEQLIAEIAAGPQPAPGWVELRGLFRFVDPLDGPGQRNEQLTRCIEGRERLLAGEDFATVAAELSQGGSKKMGGVLPRRWLASDPADLLLGSLAPGGISPVIEAGNGFWCYQVIARGEPETMAFEDLPWPVRRIIFHDRLAQALGD